MRAIPTLHEVDFGESVTWAPPAGTARYHAWIKTDSHTWFDDRDPSDMTYGGHSPRWAQVAGYDVENDVALDFSVVVAAKPAPNIEVTASGINVGWQLALGLFDGHDPEVLMVTALTPGLRARGPVLGRRKARGNEKSTLAASLDGAKVMSVDRYRLPTPNSTDAGTIAAQERRLLQTLLNTREKVAASSGQAKVMQTEGEGHELMELAALDRRVAEVRARIVWFDTAAAGNALPRAEYW